MKKPKIKFPYGISHFASIPKQGYYFVDKTSFIEQIEDWDSKFLSFLRPRRMGKSLFVSILEHYYGKEHQDKFQDLFGKYYIGQNPTPLANSYAVLVMDFSGIDTSTGEKAYQGFVEKIQKNCERFAIKYNLPDAEVSRLFKETTPQGVLETCLNIYKKQNNSSPIYLLIDEYDHFTNEILTQDLKDFKKAVTKNGYVRKFYETVKIATRDGIVDRVFITGVSPVTLDSLTSGFNIISPITNDLDFHDLMGFTQEEVSEIIDLILEDKSQKETLMNDLRFWYNGYQFHPKSPHKVYNSDMVLYFCKYFARKQSYPEEMLDINIAPDYSKLKSLLAIQNVEKNYELVKKVLYEGSIEDMLVRQFSFEIDFTDNQFTSLLFYMGYLTIQEIDSGSARIRFGVPNYVIQELYWSYFAWLIVEQEKFEFVDLRIQDKVAEMARGNIEPFLELLSLVLDKLSDRDYQNFDEKYIKIVMMSFLSMAGIYVLQSERAITPVGYADLVLLAPTTKDLDYEYIFEFKYLKKSEASPQNIQKAQSEAKSQILKYLANDEALSQKQNLLAYTLVFIKNECVVEKIEA